MPGSRPRSIGLAKWIAPAATIPSEASSRKKVVFDVVDQKLPIQPAAMFPRKLVASQIPITVERDMLGATFATSERLIGEKYSSPMVSIAKYSSSQSMLLEAGAPDQAAAAIAR